jgi:hypothetical protein
MRALRTILFLIVLFAGCKKPFDAPETSEAGTVLVVEGGIAVGDSADNKILLSRLKPLEDTTLSNPELGAIVSIVSSTGRNWLLREVSRGEYSAVNNIPFNADYKLRVTTRSGKRYETPFLKPVSTPDIDSVSWLQPQDLNIYVNSFDPTNTTKYYRWEYVETWEYRAYYESFLDFVNGEIVYRPPGDQIYSCWRTKASNTIILGSTVALSEDRISFQPLVKIPYGDEKGSVRYSIFVKQYGMTKDAFEFWNILKKNTELTGTLFDPQPSQLPGNIVCLDDPSEKVIGYVSAGRQVTKRIFIRRAELSSWPKEDESVGCVEKKGSFDEMNEALKADTTYAPAYTITGGGVAIAKKICVDCRRKGGTINKPTFW